MALPILKTLPPVVCVLIPHFMVQAEWLKNPLINMQPTLIVQTLGSRKSVVDCYPPRFSYKKGMPLQEALTESNTVSLLDCDSSYYQLQFASVLDSLEHVSPVVEEGELGTAYIDITGLEGIYDGEPETVKAVQAAVGGAWKAHIGIGPGKFAAYAAALYSRIGQPFKAPEDLGAFFYDLSIDILPLPFNTRERLRSFALFTLGDIASLPVGPFQAQFGHEGKLIWQLIHGIDKSPVTPRNREDVIEETLNFLIPTSSSQALITAVEVLLKRALARPELKGRVPRIVSLSWYGEQGIPWGRDFSFKSPSVSKRRILSRIWAFLEGTSLLEAIESLSLSLKHLTGETGYQFSVFSDVRRREQLDHNIRQLNSGLGRPAPIFWVKEIEPCSQIPEEHYALVQYVP